MRDRSARKFIVLGGRQKLVRNKIHGEKRPKGGYNSGTVAERNARARAMHKLVLREYIDELPARVFG